MEECARSKALLEVALSIESGGEGHVVESPGHSVAPSVGRHAGDTVLGLIGGQLAPQLLRSDVVLQTDKEVTSLRYISV